MKLADWRKQQGYNQQQMADALGVTQPTISGWERSHDRAIGQPQVPLPDLMRRIFQLTRGAVTPNDFYDLPAIGQPTLPLVHRGDAPLLESVDDDVVAPAAGSNQ